jgi:8-oxo-dGTP diphosphatase
MRDRERAAKRGVDCTGVGVGAALVDDEGRLFLARRGPEAKNERGLWEFTGGAVEFGETMTQALQSCCFLCSVVYCV